MYKIEAYNFVENIVQFRNWKRDSCRLLKPEIWLVSQEWKISLLIAYDNESMIYGVLSCTFCRISGHQQKVIRYVTDLGYRDDVKQLGFLTLRFLYMCTISQFICVIIMELSRTQSHKIHRVRSIFTPNPNGIYQNNFVFFFCKVLRILSYHVHWQYTSSLR